MLFPLSYRCQELSMIIKVIINLFIRLLYKFIYRFSWPPKLDIECHEKGSRIDPGYRISTPMTFSYSNLTKSVEPCIVVDLSFGASGLYIAPWCFYKEHFHVTSLPPCWRAKAIHLFSCKIVSLFRPSNMSAVKTLHWQLGYGRAILASLNWTKSVDYSEVVTVVLQIYHSNYKPVVADCLQFTEFSFTLREVFSFSRTRNAFIYITTMLLIVELISVGSYIYTEVDKAK